MSEMRDKRASEREHLSGKPLAADWLNSPQGRESLEAALRRSARRIERLEQERRVEPDMLHQPITL